MYIFCIQFFSGSFCIRLRSPTVQTYPLRDLSQIYFILIQLTSIWCLESELNGSISITISPQARTFWLNFGIGSISIPFRSCIDSERWVSNSGGQVSWYFITVRIQRLQSRARHVTQDVFVLRAKERFDERLQRHNITIKIVKKALICEWRIR